MWRQEFLYGRLSGFFVSHENILNIHMVSSKGLADLSCELDLLRCIRFSLDLLKILLHDLFHDRVIYEVGTCLYELKFHLCSRHEGCASRNIVDTLIDFLYLTVLRRADQV